MAHPLHLTMEGTSSSPMLEWHITYIWPTRKKGPTLKSNLLIKMAQHLYLTYSLEWPSTYIWPTRQNGPALTSDHVRTHPTVISEWPPVPDWAFMVIDQVPPLSQRMASAIISDQVGTNPSITSEWPCTHIWSCKTTYYSHIRKALIPRPSIPGN